MANDNTKARHMFQEDSWIEQKAKEEDGADVAAGASAATPARKPRIADLEAAIEAHKYIEITPSGEVFVHDHKPRPTIDQVLTDIDSDNSTVCVHCGKPKDQHIGTELICAYDFTSYKPKAL